MNLQQLSSLPQQNINQKLYMSVQQTSFKMFKFIHGSKA